MALKSKNSRGYFIAVEGIDGSGKSTLVKSLSEYFTGKGIPVYVTKEPGDNPIGEAHRKLSRMKNVNRYSAALLSTAERYFKMETLRKKLKEGSLVISDRYYLSGLAYHSADGITFEQYAHLNIDVLKPDVYLFLNTDLDNAEMRIGKPRDRWEKKLKEIYICYQDAIKFIETFDNARVIKLDGNLPKKQVFGNAVNTIELLLKGGE